MSSVKKLYSQNHRQKRICKHFKPFSFIFTRIQPRKNHFKMKNENTLNKYNKNLFDDFSDLFDGNYNELPMYLTENC